VASSVVPEGSLSNPTPKKAISYLYLSAKNTARSTVFLTFSGYKAQ